MWLFTPDGFYSAVQHKDDPDKIMVRARARLHAQKLVDACPDDDKPELVETPPPADYRYRVTVKRETWVYLVAKFAAEIAHTNFKNEAAKRKHPPGYMSSLHGVWSEMLRFQDDMHADSKRGRWSTISHGDSDPFAGLDAWLDRSAAGSGRGVGSGGVDEVEYVTLAEGMVVQMSDDEDMGEGEVLSVNDERGTALVHFVTPIEDGTFEEDVLTVPVGDLVVVYDPLEEEVEDALENMSSSSRPEPETFSSFDEYDDDGSWPPPKPSGWMRGA
jgi:hypothetical protein